MCAWCMRTPTRGISSPGAGCEPSCECLEFNPDPLVEQTVLSNTQLFSGLVYILNMGVKKDVTQNTSGSISKRESYFIVLKLP